MLKALIWKNHAQNTKAPNFSLMNPKIFMLKIGSNTIVSVPRTCQGSNKHENMFKTFKYKLRNTYNERIWALNFFEKISKIQALLMIPTLEVVSLSP